MADKQSGGFMRKTMQLTTRFFGKEKAIYACSAAGDRLAVALAGSSNIVFYSKTGEKEEFQVQVAAGAIQDFAFNKQDSAVAVLLKDKVVVADAQPSTTPQTVVQSDIGGPSCLAWSPSADLLAIGTSQGGLIFHHSKSGKRTNVAGKHSKKVTKLAWSSQGLLASRGEDDSIQVTRGESGENVEEFAEGKKSAYSEVEQLVWLEHPTLVDRFHASKSANAEAEGDKKSSKYQQNLERLKNGGSLGSGSLPADGTRSAAKKHPLLLAVSHKAGKELVVCGSGDSAPQRIQMGSSHGRIVSVGCSPTGDVLLATSRGWVLRYSLTDAGFTESQGDRVFSNLLDYCVFDAPKSKLAVCGDNTLRILDAKSLKEEREFRVTFDKNFGAVTSLLASKSGNLIYVASNSGLVQGFSVQTEQKSKLFGRHFALKTSPNEIILKSIDQNFGRDCLEELENSPKIAMSFAGAEVTDYMVLQNRIVVAQGNEISCCEISAGEAKPLWTVSTSALVESLAAGENSFILAATSSEWKILDIARPTASKASISRAKFTIAKTFLCDSFLAILSGSQLFLFDTQTARQLTVVSLPGNPTDLFVNEKSFEFFIWDSTKNSLLVYRSKFDRPAEEITLPEKAGLSNLLFDTLNPNVVCLVLDNAKVLTLCKRPGHFKAPLSHRFVREILKPSDLEEGDQSAELAVTLVDASITPLRLSDGYLFCLEKGATPTGCYLSSHSYKLGSLDFLGNVESDGTLAPAAPLTLSPSVPSDEVEGLFAAAKTSREPPALSESQKEYLLKAFFQTAELGLFVQSAKAADSLGISALWALLAEMALKNGAMELAQVCYQKLGNWSMAYYLRALAGRNPSALQTKADIAVILCDYDYAKTCFLKMDRPDLAVELLINLHEFPAAADLAKTCGLEEHELVIRFEMAEVDLKNEDFIKAEGSLETILKKLVSKYGVNSLGRQSPESRFSLNSKSSIKVGKENEGSVLNLTEKEPADQLPGKTTVAAPKWRKFDPFKLFRASVCSLASLFIRQGSLLRAAEALAKLPLDATEELTELANTAFEAGQFALASDIYQKIGCVRREMEARLALILKSPENSKQTVTEFSKLVHQKLPAIDDPSVLLSLANFFQDKDVGLTDKLLKKSGLLVERVRFSLAVLHDFDLAERIFEEASTPNQQAACLLADFLVQNQSLVSDSRAKAIRFLLQAGRKTEAMKLSFEIDAVDVYCRYVQTFDEGEAQALAKFYIAKRQFDKAGKFFLSSGQYEKALLSFVKAKDFDSAIDLVFKLHDEELFDLMVQVFAGETVIAANDRGFEGYSESPGARVASGDLFELIRNNPQTISGRGKSRLDALPEPVDPIYLFKLYLRFGKVDHANTIALAIIDRELIDGSYKSAYQHSCTVRSMLAKAQAKVSGELRNKIIVLHSYVLVKKALKLDNHTLAALLLNRVCSFLHYLPKNDTDILTSAVIEATKSGFKSMAYNWALTLCKPQHRSQINPKFKEKIEKIALKPVSTTDLKPENYSQAGWLVTDPKALSGSLKCPCCSLVATDAFALSCGSCFNSFVMCIATAKALLKGPKNSFVRCKGCWGMAYEAELKELMAKENECPGCEAKGPANFESVDLAEVVAAMKE